MCERFPQGKLAIQSTKNAQMHTLFIIEIKLDSQQFFTLVWKLENCITSQTCLRKFHNNVSNLIFLFSGKQDC